MLKAQHPGYEVFKMGIHGKRGVSCSDCHMPYKTEGGQKFTDHHIQSPLNNVANSCQVCHREEKDELIKNVYDNQDRIIENRDQLEVLLVRAHVEAGKAWELGASEAQMKDILHGIRLGQWRWDYVAASHGGSFHAPVELGRVLGKGIDITQETRIKLAKLLMELGFKGEVPYPAIETKAEAQKFIGLDMEKLKAENKAVLLGDMFELGNDSKTEHQKIADLVAAYNFNEVHLIGKAFSTTSVKNAFIYDSFETFKASTNKLNFSNTTILIKGSRGMALERILDFF